MMTQKELKEKIAQVVGVSPSVIKEYTKLLARATKYGGNFEIVKPKRSPVSLSHKKRVRQEYYQRVKDKRKAEKEAQKLALGIQPRPKAGRPKKGEESMLKERLPPPSRARGRPRLSEKSDL